MTSMQAKPTALARMRMTPMVCMMSMASVVSCSGPAGADKPAAAPPASRVAWGKPAAGLRLGLEADGASVTFTLENVSAAPIEVLSHVATHEQHLDWFTLRVTDGPTPRELQFTDARNRSAPVKVMLAPGASLRHRVDAAAWALRTINGARALSPGAHAASAVYAVTDAAVWSGRLASGEVSLVVPAK